MLIEALEEERQRLVSRDLQKVRKQGELIGSIRVLQRILQRPISDETELVQKEQADLEKMLQELEDALKDAPLLS